MAKLQEPKLGGSKKIVTKNMKIMTKELHHFHLLLLFFSDSILASVDERPAINWLFDNREAGHRIIGTEQ